MNFSVFCLAISTPLVFADGLLAAQETATSWDLLSQTEIKEIIPEIPYKVLNTFPSVIEDGVDQLETNLILNSVVRFCQLDGSIAHHKPWGFA